MLSCENIKTENKPWYRLDHSHNWVQDPRHLCNEKFCNLLFKYIGFQILAPKNIYPYLSVLVYKGESIGHIVIAQMDDTRPNPGAKLLLRAVEDLMHMFPYGRRRLHPVEALPSVPEGVVVVAVEEVLLRQAPQLEHVVLDLPPEGEGLQAVLELLAVWMGEPCSLVTRPESANMVRN